jgi:hypothetical protein
MSLAPLLGSVAAALVSSHIAFVGGMTYSLAGSTSTGATITVGGSLSGGLGAQTQAGDLMLICYGVGSTADHSGRSITGATSIANLYANGTSNDASVTAAYKFASGASESIVVGPTGQSGCDGAISIMVFRGVNTTTPLDVTSTTATSTSDAKPNPAAITPATGGAFIVCMGVGAGSLSGSGNVAITLTSSDLTNFIQVVAAGSTKSCACGMGYKAWSSGAFDPAQFGGSVASTTGSVAVTVALRPI